MFVLLYIIPMKKITSLILLIWLCSISVLAQQPDTASNNAAIRQMTKNYEDAWNSHNPEKLAANYTSDATWVNWFGAYYKGRDDIFRHYKQVHNTYFKNTQYYTRAVEDITYLNQDLAVVHVRTGLAGDERYPGQTFEFRRMIVVVKRDGEWKIFAGQNARLEKSIN